MSAHLVLFTPEGEDVIVEHDVFNVAYEAMVARGFHNPEHLVRDVLLALHSVGVRLDIYSP